MQKEIKMQIDHEKYLKSLKKKSYAELVFIIEDCQEAIKAYPDNTKCGYYQDEICYASQEISRRNK